MMPKAKKISARDLLGLIEARHDQDVVISECKNGPSSTGMLKMDAWVMRRSWTRFKTFCYEIKVSRQDFLRDEKWPGYMAYCHEFYFVCPSGLIQPDELPPEAGLIWSSKNGTRLYTKKKAPTRDVKIPEDLWIYIAMNRVDEQCCDRYSKDRSTRIAAWRKWAEDERSADEVGYAVNRKISDALREMRTEVALAKRKVDGYKQFKKMLDKWGIDERRVNGDWAFGHTVEKKLEEIRSIVSPKLVSQIKSAQESLARLAALIGENKLDIPDERTEGEEE